MPETFLGLDASTQSLTGIIIGEEGIVYGPVSVNYDDIQPEGHGLKNGVWKLDNDVVYSSPLVWVQAVDHLLQQLKDLGYTKDVVALSGSGQQHGSVYLSESVADLAASLDSRKPLADQIQHALSRTEEINGSRRPVSPIWMDSSTRKQMEEITRSAGGLANLLELTGSGQFERFTGPQIRRFYQENPDQYNQTVEIQLVSSFLSGLFSGVSAIAPGDAAGMSLMKIEGRYWNPVLLAATANDLEKRLPNIVDPCKVLAETTGYFVDNFGLDAAVIPWDGDNPCSLIGFGGITSGLVFVSFGTSDTFFGNTGRSIIVDKEGELCTFGAPTSYVDNMFLGCWKNGSIPRERMKDKFGMSWEQVSQYLKETEPDQSKIGVYWVDPEITPNSGKAVYTSTSLNPGEQYNIRAIVEAKAMSMMIRLQKIGIVPSEIYATGGASENDGILQLFADVTGAKVYRQQVSASAALGAALRARQGYLLSQGESAEWKDVVAPFVKVTQTFEPNRQRHETYKKMIPAYQEFESQCAMMSRH